MRVLLIVMMAIGATFNGAARVFAAAENWPTRSLSMVVPLAAGGSADVLARILASRLTDLLGQQVIVENVVGAGGMTAAFRVAKATPDGYQLLFGNVGTHAANQALYENPLYNAVTDFVPVGLIAEQPIVLIARRDYPANNLQEFTNYANINQAKMKYGSAGVGSASHLACALLNVKIGIQITHVPYRGGNPALQDLIAGRTDYQCAPLGDALPQIEGKTVRAISVLSRDRSPVLPALASAHEEGLTNFAFSIWSAFFFPKDTPSAIVRQLNRATVATLETPSVQAKLQDTGTTAVSPARRSPDYLQQFVETEIAKWSAAVKAAGISVMRP